VDRRRNKEMVEVVEVVEVVEEEELRPTFGYGDET
jgi:hypothetical protein